MVRFSGRVPASQRLNRLTVVRSSIGDPVYDLTESNPTRCRLSYPVDLLQGLAGEAGLDYRPDPRGLPEAREAVAAQYRASGWQVTADRVVLTASTSEAYGFLFKMLADPGDRILVPTPSYPLFDQLARLDGVSLVPYSLIADEEWRPDLAAIEAAPASCRSLIVVHPNNPTGSLIRPADAERLEEICRRRGWPLIADEVFLPYPLDGTTEPARSFAAGGSCLGFTLGGLSKSVGLPQAKLAWIVISGPERDVSAATERLEFIADAYLSVSGPTAGAAAGLMQRGVAIRDGILTRCRHNLDALCDLSARCPAVSVVRPQGGWSAVVRVPSILEDEDLALRLLSETGVAVHPGYLFDFAGDGYLVLSLLPPPEVFSEGVRRLLRFVDDLSRTTE